MVSIGLMSVLHAKRQGRQSTLFEEADPNWGRFYGRQPSSPFYGQFGRKEVILQREGKGSSKLD